MADEGSSGDGGDMPKINLYGYGSNVDLRSVSRGLVREGVCLPHPWKTDADAHTTI